jgi:WD40 repeat protein
MGNIAFLQPLKGHSRSVSSVAFSHNLLRLASASYDKTVKIWDTGSGVCLQTLEGHSDRVSSVAFSYDSAQLASASYDKTVKIWDTGSGACLQTLETGQTIFSISFDITSSCLHTDIGIIAIDASSTSNMTLSVTHPQNSRYQGVALSSDGAWITYNSEKLVWLPSEYRPSSSAVIGKTIGIGVGSGRVWICNVELSNSLEL